MVTMTQNYLNTHVCGHDFETQEASTLQQVNNRLVSTCCEVSWRLHGAVLCCTVLCRAVLCWEV